ncbi:unnamed protein product [Symbiodinium sp. CCMP2456]|nr:unnamed protein product [Symbiodinium sp. CCMP2456]
MYTEFQRAYVMRRTSMKKLGDQTVVGMLSMLGTPQLEMIRCETGTPLIRADLTSERTVRDFLHEMAEEVKDCNRAAKANLHENSKIAHGVHGPEAMGAVALRHWSTPLSIYYSPLSQEQRQYLSDQDDWEAFQRAVWDDVPLVALYAVLPRGLRRPNEEMKKFILTGEAWETISAWLSEAAERPLLLYKTPPGPPCPELLFTAKCFAWSKWVDVYYDPSACESRAHEEECLVIQTIDLCADVILFAFDVAYIAVDLHLFFTSAGICHVAYVSTYASILFSVATSQPSAFHALRVVGSFIWAPIGYCYTVLQQWNVARRLSTNSQVGQLISARTGGICHYCLPTGYDPNHEFDHRFHDVESYAHRCYQCVIRHCFTGDRPMFVVERVHHRLFHRCQHVVASDRDRARGQMANIMLTHSALVEESSLLKEHSYESFIGHAVRAELKLLGGNLRFLSPAVEGVDGPERSAFHHGSASGHETLTTPHVDAQRFVGLGTPLIPYTHADPGTPLDGIKIVVDLEKCDLRKNLAERFENEEALSHESKICIVDETLLETHNVPPKAKVVVPGLTVDDLSKIMVASNSHNNCIAGIGNRHYARKKTTVAWNGEIFSNTVGNPTVLIRRCVHAYINILVNGLANIDENTLIRQDLEVLEVPASEVTCELHGKSVFPIHKEIEEIATNSFTKAMIFRLAYFVSRSIKGTDTKGVNSRILRLYNDFKSGGFASTDFGSFDSSITDKCVEDHSKPGLRRIIEEALMNKLTDMFPESSDLKNASSKRWKKSDKVRFDTLTLFTSILIRYSGDGLTSVGNYIINWTIDQVIDAIADCLFTIYDWSEYTADEFFTCCVEIISRQDFIDAAVAHVKKTAEYDVETIRRESAGEHVRKPIKEFIAGEGDDRAKAYSWPFIQKFQLQDRRNKRAREVLGLVTAILYVEAGMSLEPQDRTGRVEPDKLIDTEDRIEFVSRIFVPLNDGQLMRSFPKLRKTFAVSSITFNMRDQLHTAAATKMISIMMVCDQCPLQFAYYSMIARIHLERVEADTMDLKRRKYEWWEQKLVHLIEDNGLSGNLRKVYDFLRDRYEKEEEPGLTAQMLKALSRETKRTTKELSAMIDCFNEVSGADLSLAEELTQSYATILPPV